MNNLPKDLIDALKPFKILSSNVKNILSIIQSPFTSNEVHSPKKIIELCKNQLEEFGWSLQEIQGEAINFSNYSLLQTLRTGSKIIHIDENKVIFQLLSGAKITHVKQPRRFIKTLRS
ncbi:MAG: hypothetical protein DRN27_05345 [Thermoplasmata archaeon]|nr:MAG: hypothetical protein DRN27_05345 [Thermoplasmata archaeon]